MSPHRVVAVCVIATAMAMMLLSVLLGDVTGQVVRSGILAAAFGGLCLGMAALGARVAAGIALVLTVYGGMSSMAAVHRPAVQTLADLDAGPILQGLGIAQWIPPHLSGAAFGAAEAWLVAFGLVATLSAAVCERRGGRFVRHAAGAEGADRGRSVRRAAVALTAVGALGLTVMLLRYAVNVVGGASPWAAGRGLWNGSAYIIFCAHMALPGLAVLLSLDLGRPRARVWGAALTAVAVLSIPTGQRGFAIEVVLVGLVVLGVHNRIRRPQVLVLAVLGIAGLVVTQVARDVARTNVSSPADVWAALSPSQSLRTLENQFASFQWAVDVSANEPYLNRTVSPARILLKPVPRQVFTTKPGGLAEEFTRYVYPWTARDGVTLAVPLYAELHVYGGLALLLLGALVLGAFGGLGVKVGDASGVGLRPVTYVAVFWTVAVLVRGDLFNALPVAAGWLGPVVLLLLAARRAPRGSTAAA